MLKLAEEFNRYKYQYWYQYQYGTETDIGRPGKRSETIWEQELRAKILLPARDPQLI